MGLRNTREGAEDMPTKWGDLDEALQAFADAAWSETAEDAQRVLGFVEPHSGTASERRVTLGQIYMHLAAQVLCNDLSRDDVALLFYRMGDALAVPEVREAG